MKTILLLLSLPFAFGCQSDRRKEASQAIKQILIEQATKEKAPLTTYEVNTISVEEVGDNRLDTLRRQSFATNINYYSDRKYEAEKEAINQKVNAVRFAGLGLESTYIKTAAEKESEALAMNDSIAKLLKLDSIASLRIKNREDDPRIYFLTKSYIRSISGGKTQTDTTEIVLDKNLKLVKWWLD